MDNPEMGNSSNGCSLVEKCVTPTLFELQVVQEKLGTQMIYRNCLQGRLDQVGKFLLFLFLYHRNMCALIFPQVFYFCKGPRHPLTQ